MRLGDRADAPRALSFTNPALTIMALASRLAEKHIDPTTERRGEATHEQRDAEEETHVDQEAQADRLMTAAFRAFADD